MPRPKHSPVTFPLKRFPGALKCEYLMLPVSPSSSTTSPSDSSAARRPGLRVPFPSSSFVSQPTRSLFSDVVHRGRRVAGLALRHVGDRRGGQDVADRF